MIPSRLTQRLVAGVAVLGIAVGASGVATSAAQAKPKKGPKVTCLAPDGRNIAVGGKITVVQTDANGQHPHKETFVCGADGGWKSANIVVTSAGGVVAQANALHAVS